MKTPKVRSLRQMASDIKQGRRVGKLTAEREKAKGWKIPGFSRKQEA